MKKVFVAAALAATSLLAAVPAEAATRMYDIAGGLFDDGTSFSGSFGYDDVSNSYSLGSIKVSAGKLSAFTYDANTSYSYGSPFGTNSRLFIENGFNRYINLSFATPLAGSTGPVSLVVGVGNSITGSFECSNCGTRRNIIAGTVSATGAVPEPATWAMMILGMGAVGFAMRRRSKVKTTVRFA